MYFSFVVLLFISFLLARIYNIPLLMPLIWHPNIMKQLLITCLLAGLSQALMAQLTVAASATGNNICLGGSSTLSASAPGATSYSWSPSTGLNTTNGATVIASPAQTTTYTVNASGPGGTGSQNVTVSVNPASFIAAGVSGGSQVCTSINISGTTYFRDGNCNLITMINPAGSQPVSGTVTACVKVETKASRMGTMDYYASRHYDIEPSNNAASATANVTLVFLQSEFDNYNLKASDSGFSWLPTGPTDADGIKNIRLRQFHGTGTNPNNYTGWIDEFRSTSAGASFLWNSSANWWELTIPVNGFSGFYLTTKKSGMPVLPIHILYFKAADKQKHVLSWKLNCTGSENKIALERSSDGLRFTQVAVWNPSNQQCNLPFRYQDFSAGQGLNYYRLKVSDADGEINYSNVVTTGKESDNWIYLSPNITSSNSMLHVLSPERSEISLFISDANGRKVKELKTKLEPGNNEIQLQTASLTQGMYFVHVNLNGQRSVLRLVKQ